MCKNEDFCNVIMPSKDDKMLEFHLYQKYYKALFVIYADLECWIEKLDKYKNNPKNSCTTQIGEHISSGFSISAISSFKSMTIRMMYTEV